MKFEPVIRIIQNPAQYWINDTANLITGQELTWKLTVRKWIWMSTAKSRMFDILYHDNWNIKIKEEKTKP